MKLRIRKERKKTNERLDNDMEKIRVYLALPLAYVAIGICKIVDWIAGDDDDE